MIAEYKKDILEKISKALDEIPYGKIIVDIRGETSPADLEIMIRTRYTPKKNKSM